MKELSIEEKAKAYDEVIQKLRGMMPNWERLSYNGKTFLQDLIYIIPELKESEDEKIRGAIIYFISHTPTIPKGVINKETMIAWLEKQGEKDSQVICPTFTFDDILALQCCMETVKKVQEDNELYKQLQSLHDRLHDAYWLEKQGEQKPNPYSGTSFEYNSHTWGMCARDNGVDILCDKHIIGHLEKQGEQKSQRMISAEAKEAMYDKPADTVEQKCKESKTKVFDAPTPFEDKLYAFVAACEFLAIPSKIEFILEHSQEILDAAREQIGKEQRSAWSEEDEKFVHGLIRGLSAKRDIHGHTTFSSDCIDITETIDWLKSLKDRYTWKPSEEQIEALKDAIRIKPLENPSDNLLWTLYEQLNKLK